MSLADLLERRFRLAAAGTTVRRELLAGLTTFLTLSYVLFVQPAVLGLCGMDPEGVLFATCVASALACFLMALLANLPIALAPAMGHNFFFALVVCGAMGFTWQEALAANFVAGLLFLVLAPTGLREAVMRAIPTGLRHAIAAGIGLLIAMIGLQWGGIVVGSPATYVMLGSLHDPVALLTLGGLAWTATLWARGARGAILLGLFGTAAAGLAATRLLDLDPPLVVWRGLVGAPPSPASTFLALDFRGLLGQPFDQVVLILSIFLILDLFDTVGTLIGVGSRAGLLVDGELPAAKGALAADAAGTAIGAALGTSTVTSYVESAAGVAAGGRTGLVAVVCGLCFLGSLVLLPLVETIGAGVPVGPETLRYPVIAPVLILVGAMMIGSVRHVEWEDPVEALPAFLTILVMPLSFSISDGIAFGFVSYSLLTLATGRGRRASWMVHAFAVLFLARYVWMRV